MEKEDLFFFPLENPELAAGPCLSGLQHKPWSCWQERLEKVLSYFGSNFSVCIRFFSIPLKVLDWVVWIPLTNTCNLCLSGVNSFFTSKLVETKASFYQFCENWWGSRGEQSEWVPAWDSACSVCPATWAVATRAPAVGQRASVSELLDALVAVTRERSWGTWRELGL